MARTVEESRAYQRKYYELNKEKSREASRKRCKKYREKHREKRLEAARERYSQNSEKERERVRLYREKNREKVNAASLADYYKNREHYNALQKKKYDENPEIFRGRAKKSREKYLEKYRKQDREYNKTTVKGKYRLYKACAKKRKKSFDLTLEEFSTFWQEPCHYCGSEISNIGIDRVDNGQGYSMQNIVPCCKLCNYMKNKHSVDVFVSQCKKIIKHFNK